jgi:hypothetical protein
MEEDLYRMARSIALAEQCSISSAINQLLRRSIEHNVPPKGSKKSFSLKGRRRLPVSHGTRPFSSADVAALELADDQDQTP